MSKKQIIIIKKGKGHGGHHGGAWKVAYADFVTAMMSLFIVLWLLNSSEHVRKAVAGYFNDPLGRSTLNGSSQGGEGTNAPATEDNDNIEQLKDKVQRALMQAKDFKALSKQIEMTITPEGLRIELLESKNGTFFDSGSANLSGNGQEILDMLAKQLAAVPNRLSIRRDRITATGSCRPTGPTRRAASCSRTGSAPTRFRRCAAMPTRSCGCRRIRSTRRTAGFR
jgi:chemotaxis protein MotB